MEFIAFITDLFIYVTSLLPKITVTSKMLHWVSDMMQVAIMLAFPVLIRWTWQRVKPLIRAADLFVDAVLSFADTVERLEKRMTNNEADVAALVMWKEAEERRRYSERENSGGNGADGSGGEEGGEGAV